MMRISEMVAVFFEKNFVFFSIPVEDGNKKAGSLLVSGLIGGW